MHGIETTRTLTPSSASACAACSVVGDLGARRDQDQLRRLAVVRVPQRVSAAAATPSALATSLRSSVGMFWRESSSATGPSSRSSATPPRGSRLVGVARADHPQVRDRAQRRVVLDRLVRGTVLAEAHGVVCPHPHHGQAHQRRQPDAGAHVVGEHQERRAVGLDDAAVRARAVRRSRPSRARGCRTARCAPHGPSRTRRRPRRGLRRLDQVRRAAEHRRPELGERRHRLLPGRARRDLLAGLEPRQRLAPALAQLALPGQVPVGWPSPRTLRATASISFTCHSRCASAPASRSDMCSYTRSSTQNFLSGSKPITSLVARTSSSPSAEPCDLAVSTAFGAGKRDVRAHLDERRPILVFPRRRRARASSSSTSSESSTRCTCQPSASKRCR